MLVRLLIAFVLLWPSMDARADAPEQEASFVLTVEPPVGGKATLHKTLTEAVQAREAALKPALLAKTKPHPASRLSFHVKLEVQADGSLKAGASKLTFRDAKGDIKDDSIQPVATDTLIHARKVSKQLKGATVEVAVSILQP